MGNPIQLIPLLCYRCQTAIPAGTDEVAWVCPQCGAGLMLSEEKGTAALDIHFAEGRKPGVPGRPYWVAPGTVSMRQRQIYGGGDQGGQARGFWSTQHNFVVPAFACTLDELIEAGTRFIVQPPMLQDSSPGSFLPVVTGPEDVHAYAEFIVLGIEASRKDKLKFVDFSLALEAPALWILP